MYLNQASQILSKGSFIHSDPPYIANSCRKQLRDKLICRKKLHRHRSGITRCTSVLGYLIFRTVFMSMIVLELNQSSLIHGENPSPGAIVSNEKWNSQGLRFATSDMHDQLSGRHWVRFRDDQFAFKGFATGAFKVFPKFPRRCLVSRKKKDK